MNAGLLEKNYKKIKWGILCFFALVLFLSFLYGDLVITYTHSLNFLDCLFKGDVLNFYEYTLDRFYLGYPADYYILIYVIFGIWNLPIWILSRLFGFDQYSVLALLWAKAILIPFIVGIFYTIREMLKLLDEKNREPIYFLMASSVLFVLPVFFMGQYDIISLFFVMCGILQCIKEDGISWKVVFFFSLAIPIKLLAIFPVLIIILLKEKKIIELVKKIAGIMLATLFCILPYIRNDAFYEATQYNDGWFGKLEIEKLPSGVDGISIFWLCFFAICIIAYQMTQSNRKQLFKQMMWLLTAFYGFFFIFVDVHPQWSVLLVPFIILLVSRENHDYKLNRLLEIIVELTLIIIHAYRFDWVYLTDQTSYLFLKNVEAKFNLLGIDSLGQITVIERCIPLISALYLAAMLGILILNHPWKKMELSENVQMMADDIRETQIGGGGYCQIIEYIWIHSAEFFNYLCHLKKVEE